MKKLFSFFTALLFLCACSPQEEASAADTPAPSADVPLDEQIYSFDINNIPTGCDSPSEIICAINLSIKCTINPDFSECAENKDAMPGFVFMRDESLQRPTSQTYKIGKIKPLDDGSVEIYTQSTCNGNWFGLCNGNIIYVMKNNGSRWIVKDLYAVES